MVTYRGFLINIFVVVLFCIDPAVKIDFRLSLVITSSAPWVSATQYLEMYNSKRNVIVKVDPTNLTEGVHYAM